jgi:hypothetical protein
MSDYILELTRDEALALMMLLNSSHGHGFVRGHLSAIVDALLEADATLGEAQYDGWKKIGRPTFELIDQGELTS